MPDTTPAIPDAPARARPSLLHQAHLSQSLPDWLMQASEQARITLRQVTPAPRHWPPDLPYAQQTSLNQAHINHWKSHHAVRQQFDTLHNIEAFATPLLRQALQRQYHVDPALDLKRTFINLYVPLTTPIFGLNTGAVKNWRVSLLDAALHNFEAFEADPDAHTTDSGFITQPSADGQFQVLQALTAQVPIAGFISLCRQLDLGRQYKMHLDDALGVTDRSQARALKTAVREYIKTALTACTHHALAHQHISRNLHE